MLSFKKFKNEVKDLVNLYTKQTWPYHPNRNPTEDEIRKRFESGWYEDDRETFWIEENDQKIGLIVVADISDNIPILFDVRVDEEFRGKGYGEQAVNWVSNYIFKDPTKIRIEAYTRKDNYSMRKVFYKSFYVKEGYLRNSWENADGSMSDTIVYGLIRPDWEKRIRTSTQINDFLY